jgi:hypothetical protein
MEPTKCLLINKFGGFDPPRRDAGTQSSRFRGSYSRPIAVDSDRGRSPGLHREVLGP